MGGPLLFVLRRPAAWRAAGLLIAICVTLAPAGLSAGQAPFVAHLPLIMHDPACPPVPGASYITLSADPPGPHLPPADHPDLSLAVRGYQPTDAYRGLVDYTPEPDPKAPQLGGLFSNRRLPVFANTYQVHDWDWRQMQRGPLIDDPPVSALGMATTPGETIQVPDSGYDIGSGCEVLVLFADSTHITLKYTREDNVVYGYTLHVDGICVEPDLLALYEQCDAAGRQYLPALQPYQAFGYASGAEVVIAIRDTGTFLDARSRRDWWRGY